MKRLLLGASLLALAAIAAVAIIGWQQRQEWLIRAHEWIESSILESAVPPKPDPERYEVLVSELEGWRKQLAQRHQQAKTPEQKAAVESDARLLLETTLPSLMRCWIGTPWDFNGTAAKPGDGKIACGYFVSTVLRDAGYQVNRYRLAQQASSNIIHSFIDKGDATLAVGQDYDTFLQQLGERETGIYLCGLDTHVAFIVKTNDGFRFIHSSGSSPWTVVDESPEQASVLRQSKWRMLGNLTASSKALRTWLSGSKVKVRR